MNRQETKTKLSELADRELLAYERICQMSLTCIQSRETRELTTLHLELVRELIQERNLTR